MKPGIDFWESTTAALVGNEISGPENLTFTTTTMKRLSPDPIWTETVTDSLHAGSIEIRSVVAWLASTLQPDTYLEVGVRRGFSMAMMGARRPAATLYGFDLWVSDYAGVPNPGPEFVRSELAKVGFRGQARFISGNSHLTLPAFFLSASAPWWRRLRSRIRYGRAPASVDLAVIDGDHSLLGAYKDLTDVMPRIAVGGALVFDDIAADPAKTDPAASAAELGPDPHGWGDLLGVWKVLESEYEGFRFFTFTDHHPGVGFAVRLR